jgi:ferrous iron transport protein A
LKTSSPILSVAALAPGSEALLVEIGGPPAFRRRLMEMGLLPGTRVRLVRRIATGGVVEVEVRRSRLSLRDAEASQILVRAS